MDFPADLRYTETHEWARKRDGTAEVGLTAYAVKEIQDIVFIELPKAGRRVEKGKSCGAIETVKAAFDLYAPLTGIVKEIHAEAAQKPQIVSEDPYGAGWLFRMECEKPAEWDSLLDAETYQKKIRP